MNILFVMAIPVVNWIIPGMNFNPKMERIPIIQFLRLEAQTSNLDLDMEILRHNDHEKFRLKQGNTHF